MTPDPTCPPQVVLFDLPEDGVLMVLGFFVFAYVAASLFFRHMEKMEGKWPE